MFNFQGLAGQKTVENFGIKVLAASKIKLSAKTIETIGLTEGKGVFLDKDATSNSFWIAAIAEGGKKLSKQNTFGHKVLNQTLGEGTEWDVDVAGVKEFEGTQFFPLTMVAKEEAPKEEVAAPMAQDQEVWEGDVAPTAPSQEEVVDVQETPAEDVEAVTTSQFNDVEDNTTDNVQADFTPEQA